MPKQIHPADQADLDAIETATHFVVHMRRGPADVFKQEAPTLVDAVVIADQVRAENKGLGVLVYAITPEGNSIPVTKAMQKAASGATGGRQATAGREPAGKPQPAPAPHKAASKAAGARTKRRRAEIAENAAKGILPPVPDFSAPTHTRFRKKLGEIVAMVEAGNIEGLKAMVINPVSSSPKAMAKYRDLAVVALETGACSSRLG